MYREFILEKMLGDCVERDGKWVEVAKELHEITNLRAYYSFKEQELKDRLKGLSEDKNSAGGSFIFLSTERVGAIDYSSIPQIRKIDLDVYRKESIKTWKLSKI